MVPGRFRMVPVVSPVKEPVLELLPGASGFAGVFAPAALKNIPTAFTVAVPEAEPDPVIV
jgi:hypothetical protein